MLSYLINWDFLAQFVKRVCVFEYTLSIRLSIIQEREFVSLVFVGTKLLNKLSKKIMVTQILKQIWRAFQKIEVRINISTLKKKRLLYIPGVWMQKDLKASYKQAIRHLLQWGMKSSGSLKSAIAGFLCRWKSISNSSHFEYDPQVVGDMRRGPEWGPIDIEWFHSGEMISLQLNDFIPVEWFWLDGRG